MRIHKKLDPYKRLEHIRAAGELQWDINQGKIVKAGANPLLDRDRKIYLAGWDQGAAWAHKAVAEDMERVALTGWKPHAKYEHLKSYAAAADGSYDFPDEAIEECYRVLLTFVEMTEEALANPEMQKPELAANKAICQFLCDDLKRALNAIEVTQQWIDDESGENAG